MLSFAPITGFSLSSNKAQGRSLVELLQALDKEANGSFGLSLRLIFFEKLNKKIFGLFYRDDLIIL
jgi:hypothetical protein